MSWISQVYGGKEDTKALATETWSGIEKSLIEKKNFLKNKIEQEIVTARKNRTKNKIIAIQALMNIKRFEKQIQKMDWCLSVIEQQKEIIKSANSSNAIVTAMGNVADAVKATNQHKGTDSEVHDIINLNEDELEKELERLVQEKLDKESSGIQITAESLAVSATSLPTLDIQQVAILKNKSSKYYQDRDRQKSQVSKL